MISQKALQLLNRSQSLTGIAVKMDCLLHFFFTLDAAPIPFTSTFQIFTFHKPFDI